MGGTSTRNVEIALLFTDKDSGEKKIVSIGNALVKVTQETEKLNQAQRSGAKTAKDYSTSQEAAGQSLNHFARHAAVAATSVTSFGGLIKMVTKELSTFSFQMWVLASNTALWSGIIGGAAMGINKLVQEGSKFAEVQSGFNAMAASSGMLGDEILNKTRPAVRGLISDLDIMKNYNTAVALHVKLSADSFAKMSGAAIVMSRVMGTDVNYAMNSLITGLGRQSMRVLDNIGVILKAGEAYKIYGERIGVLPKNMDDATKRVAFQTIAIERLDENIKKIGTPITSMGQAFTQAKVDIENATMKTLAWVVTSDSGMNSALSFKTSVEQLGKAIWDSRERIGEFITNAVTFGKTVVEMGASVVNFLQTWGSTIITLAEVGVFLKLLGIFKDVGIALQTWGLALAKTGAEEEAWALNAIKNAEAKKMAVVQAEMAEYVALQEATAAKIAYISATEAMLAAEKPILAYTIAEAEAIKAGMLPYAQLVGLKLDEATVNEALIAQKKALAAETVLEAASNSRLAASQALANAEMSTTVGITAKARSGFAGLSTGILGAIFSFGNIVTALIVGGVYLNKYINKLEDLDKAFVDLNKGISKPDGFQKFSRYLDVFVALPIETVVTGFKAMFAAMSYNYADFEKYVKQGEQLGERQKKALKDLFNPPSDDYGEEGAKGMFVKLTELGKQYKVEFEKDANIVPAIDKIMKDFSSMGSEKGFAAMSKFWATLREASADGAKVTLSAIKDTVKQLKLSALSDTTTDTTPEAPKKTAEQILGIDPEKIQEAYGVFHQVYAKYGEDSAQAALATRNYGKEVMAVADKLFPNLTKAFGLGWVIEQLQKLGYAIPDAVKSLNWFGMEAAKPIDLKFSVNGKPLDKALDDDLKTILNAPKLLEEFSNKISGASIDVGRILNFGNTSPIDQFISNFSNDLLNAQKQLIDLQQTDATKLGISEDTKSGMLVKLEEDINSAKVKLTEFADFVNSNPVGANFFLGLSDGFKTFQQTMAETVTQLGGDIRSQFEGFFSSVLSGSKSLGEAFQELGKNMLSSIVSALAKIVVNWVVSHLVMAMAAKTKAQVVSQSIGQEAAAAFAGSVAKASANGIETASNISTAASGFFKAHSWIPWVGAALAIGFIALMMNTMGSLSGGASGAAAVPSGPTTHWGKGGGVTTTPGKGISAASGWWELPGAKTDAFPMVGHGKEMVINAPNAEKLKDFTEKVTNPQRGNSYAITVQIGSESGPPVFLDKREHGKVIADAVIEHIKDQLERQTIDKTYQADPYDLYR